LAGTGGDPEGAMPAAGQGLDATSNELTTGSIRTSLMRLCASLWFLVLAAVCFQNANSLLDGIAAGRTGLDAWATLLSQGCIVLFYTIICCIMLLRPDPVSEAKGAGPVLLALAGTYGAWLIPLLPRGPELPALAAASAAILLFSEMLIIYTLLTLGWSFSLIPQARHLVMSGPYALVRHPLYLAEEMAIAGILLQYAWFAALPFLILHASVQIRRMLLEEKILVAAVPEYAAYARRTPRLIPGVW